jgi:DNA-binding CsgD family transcriptional regulator/PAS domain-containing protein
MNSIGIDELSRVINALYEAAYDPSQWPETIGRLNRLFDGSRACIAYSDGGKSTALASLDDPGFTVANEALLGVLTEAAPLLVQWSDLPAGQVFRSIYHLDRPALMRTRLWTEYCRPRDMFDGLSVNLLQRAGSYWFFDVQRGERQRPFEEEEISALGLLAPHLIRSGEIGRLIEATRETATAFSHLPFGLLITDGSGKVLRLNEAAESVLARPDAPLRLKNGRLAPVERKAAAELGRMLGAVCAETSDFPGAGGTIVLASGDDDLAPARVVVSVAPYADMTIYGQRADRRAAVILRDLRMEMPEGLAEMARMTFSLSPAEARFAVALAAGRSLQQIAVESGITPKTAHTYLARIYRKTGTMQQSQLVALLRTLGHSPRMI